MKAMGVSDGANITRAHVLVAKGGVVVEVQVGIGSKDSVPKALEFAQKK